MRKSPIGLNLTTGKYLFGHGYVKLKSRPREVEFETLIMASPFRKNDVLVAGLVARDRNALEYFFRRYYYGLKLHVDMDEDLAMEAFEIALEKISEYNALKSKFITWVYRIGRNLFLKRKRKDNQEQTVFAEDLLRNYDEADTGGDDREEWIAPTAYSEEVYGDFFKARFVDAEFRRQVEKALGMLPKRDQACCGTIARVRVESLAKTTGRRHLRSLGCSL